MWLRSQTKMKYSNRHYLRSVVLLTVLLCFANIVARGANPRRMKLSDHDRASIVGSVVRNIFKSGSTYEGKYFVLGDNLRPKWIPRVAGYDLALITRKEIESSKASLNYYVLWLRPLKNSVHVTVRLYDSQTGTFPHVIVFYSYQRAGHKWRGRPLGGGGD